MANRHKDFNILLAKKFQNLEFAQSYVMGLINDEKMHLEEALRETIVAMGLQNFSKKANLSIQQVSDFVNGRKKMSHEKMARCLKDVFGLATNYHVDIEESKVA